VTVAQPPLEAEVGIDPVALRARYRQERDKRLRPDALGQYRQAVGEFAHYRTDPFADPEFTREPLSDEVEVVVIGGGLGGLLAGARMREAGVEDLRIIERGADFGGVWYWNRYPGVACDTQAMLYLPMLEELGYTPPRKYATGAEIRAHWQRIAHRFDLYRDACFQTEVTGLRWDDEAERWIVSTNRGDAIRARFVTIALGPMERPKLPGIPGIETFQGHSFHTSRWDYAYTGGSADGQLTGLAEKRVGIIGTGATAIQCIPHLAEGAQHLYVFQRTPSSVDVKNDGELDLDRLRDLGPGWQQRLWDNFTALVSGIYLEEDLVGDGWTSIISNISTLIERKHARGETVENPLLLAQLADYMKMEEIRRRVDDVVAHPSVAEALKPWYDRFCKRPCFSDVYLQTFNRPNVTLVDTSAGKGVERITEGGVVVDGTEYPVDCLVLSTGFDVGTPFVQRIGYEIVGRGAQTLAQKWADGAATQHGIASHGYPNLFIMSVVQTGVSLNFTHMISEQAQHIAYIVGRAESQGIAVIEVSREAEAAWCAEMDRVAPQQADFLRECTPSYFNFEGDLARRNVRNSQYGGGPTAFYKLLADWRAQGTMPGLELTYRAAADQHRHESSAPRRAPVASSDTTL
jgi:cation diffusion facilitator CzcD-associated flavoprotein CzcO